MAKKISYTTYKVVLVNPNNRNSFQMFSIVRASDEDYAMTKALAKYPGLSVDFVEEI